MHRQITLSILDAPYLRENKVPVFYTAHDYVTVCPGYLMLDGDGRVCDACLADGRSRHREPLREGVAREERAGGDGGVLQQGP